MMRKRELRRGQTVLVSTSRHSPLATAAERRQYCRRGTLVRPYPGGAYDSGTMWMVDYGTGEPLPADESMMSVAEVQLKV